MATVVKLKQATQATMPRRRPNGELRTREHLTESEVEQLMEAAKGNRYGHRDATMILAHPSLLTCGGSKSNSGPPPCTSAGSRKAPRRRIPSSATSCGHCDACSANRSPSHPSCSLRSAMRRSVVRVLRRCCSVLARPPRSRSSCTRTCSGTPVASPWRIRGMIRGSLQAYLGHKNIQHTVRYTELAPTRFKDFWRD